MSKIVGPSYAITSIDPPLGQISGNMPITITGVGFTQTSCTVYFTPGNAPAVGNAAKSPSCQAVFVSETEITAVTPDFKEKGQGQKEAIVQIAFQGQDLSTTYVPFSFFLDTKAEKSVCYGPGLMEDCAINEPVEFVIQARNENEENRGSGRDTFKVTIKTVVDPDDENAQPVEIPSEIVDTDDGKYYVKYQVDQECAVDIKISYEDQPGIWKTVRGAPYRATFNPESPASVNALTGPSLLKAAHKRIESMQGFMKETQQGATVKDKDLTDVRVLLGIKDCMEVVTKQNDKTTLILDQLDESLKFLASNGISKDKEMKQTKKLFDDWNSLKKLSKEVKKEIGPRVAEESKKNAQTIVKHEEELKQYIALMKKRDFYKYDTGREQALSSLDGVTGEINGFIETTDDLKFKAEKFDQTGAIDASESKISEIQSEVGLMQTLWAHIDVCQSQFKGYMDNKWLLTNTDEMEEQVKGLERTLKGMKCDKKCNAYIGILEEIKKWLKFLPLVSQLREPAMRDRHWQMVKDKLNNQFAVDDNLTLGFIANLDVTQYADDIEEITDQAGQEAKMEKTLKNIDEFWVSIEFEFQQHKGSDVQMLRLSEENFEALEENQTQVNGMFSSRYLAHFEDQCIKWQKGLASISEIVTLCGEVQRNWSFLEQLFIHSAEVKKELPTQSEQFVDIDKEVKKILADAY